MQGSQRDADGEEGGARGDGGDCGPGEQQGCGGVSESACVVLGYWSRALLS